MLTSNAQAHAPYKIQIYHADLNILRIISIIYKNDSVQFLLHLILGINKFVVPLIHYTHLEVYLLLLVLIHTPRS